MPSIAFLKNWTIDISKVPQYSAFRGKFNIQLDYILLKNIMLSTKEIFTDDRKRLLLPILNKINRQTGILEVEHNPRYGLGRFYPNDSISPICVSRHIKHTLFSFLDWIDLDMIKGHPSMLYFIALANGIQLHAFKHYLENFEEVVETLSAFYSVDGEEPLSKDNIKELFSILVYGGGFSTWIGKLQENNIEISCETKHEFIVAFSNECKDIMSIVYLNNPVIVQKIKGEITDEYKLKQRTISYFCGTIENEILFLCYKILLKYGIVKPKTFALEYDGICCKRPTGNIDLNAVVIEINQNILSKTGLDVKMKWKDYAAMYVHIDLIEERNTISNAEPVGAIPIAIGDAVGINEEEDVQVIVNNDNEAADLFFNKVENILFACNNSLYLKDNHIWICDIGIITNKMIELIMNSKVVKVNDKGKILQYAQNLSSAKNIFETLIIKIKNKNIRPELYLKFHTTTTNYLCFEDGVLDFKNKRFVLWADIDFEYYSTVMIRRPFQQSFLNPNEEHITEVLDKILRPMFNRDLTQALKLFARAISGNYMDKNWMKYQGNRNCGKAVIETINKSAFGDYVQTISSTNFVCQRVTGGEDARNFEWASVLEFARLGIAQESSEPDDESKGKGKINGNIIKKINSGGDWQKCRKIYQPTYNFIIDAFLMLFGNGFGDIVPKDTLEPCLEISSVFQYKTQEFIDNEINKGTDERIINTYIVGDPSVKRKAGESVEWADALVHILLRYWEDKPITIIRDVNDEELNVRSIILNQYDIDAGNKKLFTATDEILAYLKNNKMEINSKKLKPELESLGCELGKKKIAGKTLQGYFGISEKDTCDEDDEC